MPPDPRRTLDTYYDSDKMRLATYAMDVSNDLAALFNKNKLHNPYCPKCFWYAIHITIDVGIENCEPIYRLYVEKFYSCYS